MTPTLIHLRNFKPRELSTSTFIHEAYTMQTQSALHSRSTTQSNSEGGLGENTIIFIVLGVVCLLVILIGFYLVSRPRAASSAAPNVPGLHLQHSPITHSPRPRYGRDLSQHWKIWRARQRTSRADPPAIANTPTSQLSPSPITITAPSRIMRPRGASKTYPPIIPRPSHARRITSLSVATSFSNSHITEEVLSEFRASAYDLDTDLQTEMLNSARDDTWMGHILAVKEDGCGDMGVEKAMETRGDASPIIEGSVERRDSPSMPPTQWKGDDYENPGACESVAPSSRCSDGKGVGVAVTGAL